MNKLEMLTIINQIKKEDIHLVSKNVVSLAHNKNIFKKYQILYPNLLKNSEIVYIFKYNNDINELLDNMFCYCGNKKIYTTRFSNPYSKYCCQKCCKKSKKYQQNRLKSWHKTWNTHTQEEKDEIHRRQQENRKMTEDSIKRMVEHKREKVNNWTEEFKKQLSDKLSKNSKRIWENRSEEEKIIIGNSISSALNTVCDNGLTVSQNAHIKGSQTYFNKTGYYNPRKNPEVIKIIQDKNKQKRSKTEEITRNTMNIRYNGWYTSTQKHKDLWKDEDFKNSFLQKQHETKKQNGTFNTSYLEDEGYLKLLTKFPDAIHHYSIDPRYPFECDFYIPNLDLFIECHYFWTHGDPKYNCHEPFNKNSSKHQEMLQRWKSKNTKFYDNAIKVWTYYDPLKLKIFQDNNLNYKIFYTEKEFNEWFLSI